MALAPRFNFTPPVPPAPYTGFIPTSAGTPFVYPAGTTVDHLKGVDIAEEYGIISGEDTFSESQITQAEIKAKIEALFVDEVTELGKWTARYNYYARKFFKAGEKDIRDKMVEEKVLDERYESYVKEGKLKEKLLEIRADIIGGRLTDIQKDKLIPMLVMAVFMNARYGTSKSTLGGQLGPNIYNVFDKEVLHAPKYETLKALFAVQLDEYKDICPIDEKGEIVLFVPHDAFDNPLRPSAIDIPYVVPTGAPAGAPAFPTFFGVEVVLSGGNLVGVDPKTNPPTLPTPHTFFQVYTSHGIKMMNGQNNEILTAEFEPGKRVEISDIEFSEIEEVTSTIKGRVGMLKKIVAGPSKYFQTVRYITTDGNIYAQKNEFIKITPPPAPPASAYQPVTSRLGGKVRGTITLETSNHYENTFIRVEGEQADYDSEDLKAIAKSLDIKTFMRSDKTLFKEIMKISAKKSTGSFSNMVYRYNHMNGTLAIPQHGVLSVFHPSNNALTETMIYTIGKEIGIYNDVLWEHVTDRNTLVAEIICRGKQHEFLEVYYRVLISGMDEMWAR